MKFELTGTGNTHHEDTVIELEVKPNKGDVIYMGTTGYKVLRTVFSFGQPVRKESTELKGYNQLIVKQL